MSATGAEPLGPEVVPFEALLAAEKERVHRLSKAQSNDRDVEKRALVGGARRAIAGGRHAEALPWAQRLILLAPNDPLSHALLRESQALADPSPLVREAAVSHLIEGIGRWPTSVPLARAMVTVALSLGRRGAAQAALTKLDELAPNEPMLDDLRSAIEALPTGARHETQAIDWRKNVVIVASFAAILAGVSLVQSGTLTPAVPVVAAPAPLACDPLAFEGKTAVCKIPRAALAALGREERSARINLTLTAAMQKQSAVRSLQLRDSKSGELLATKLSR